MPSFLRSASRNDAHEPVDADRDLLDEFAALDTVRQNEIADRLAVLWHCFVDQFRSPAEFHREPRTNQDAYIAKFERVALRSAEVRHSEKGHLHYSVALMLHFLRIAQDGARRQSALELSGCVAKLINGARDRELNSRRSHLVDALSLSLLGSPEQASTEVIVDRSMDFHDASDEAEADADHVSAPIPDEAPRPLRRRAKYMRDGERWVRGVRGRAA